MIDKIEAFALLRHTLMTTTIWQLRGIATNKTGSMCAGFLCQETLRAAYGDGSVFPYGTVISSNVQNVLVYLNDFAHLTFHEIGELIQNGTIHPELTNDELDALYRQFPRQTYSISDGELW